MVHSASSRHELVEVPEVVAHLLVGERLRRAQEADVLDDRAGTRPGRGRAPLRGSCRRRSSTSAWRELLDQAEVEERDLPAGPEQVVARVRVAVERVQPVEAAEHEAVDGLGGQVALVLATSVSTRRSGRPSASSVVSTRCWTTARRTTAGTWMNGWPRVVVGEQLLVGGLDARSRAPRRGAPGARRRAARGRGPGRPAPSPAKSRPALSRSASMASSTPGYCTLTATARPSWVMARCTWPIDAAAIGTGSHSANTSSGGAPSSARDHLRGQLGRSSAGRPAAAGASASRTGSGRPWSR